MSDQPDGIERFVAMRLDKTHALAVDGLLDDGDTTAASALFDLVETLVALVDEHRRVTDEDGFTWCGHCYAEEREEILWRWPCSTMRKIATTWSKHPDFDDEAWSS